MFVFGIIWFSCYFLSFFVFWQIYESHHLIIHQIRIHFPQEHLKPNHHHLPTETNVMFNHFKPCKKVNGSAVWRSVPRCNVPTRPTATDSSLRPKSVFVPHRRCSFQAPLNSPTNVTRWREGKPRCPIFLKHKNHMRVERGDGWLVGFTRMMGWIYEIYIYRICLIFRQTLGKRWHSKAKSLPFLTVNELFLYINVWAP